MAFLAPCCRSPKWVLTGLWATGEAQRRTFPSLHWSHCGFQQCTNWRRQLSTTNTQVQFAHSSIQITGKWVRPSTRSSHTHSHGPAKTTGILISRATTKYTLSHPFSELMLGVKGQTTADSRWMDAQTTTDRSAWWGRLGIYTKVAFYSMHLDFYFEVKSFGTNSASYRVPNVTWRWQINMQWKQKCCILSLKILH